jgi:hypothetical protein
LQARRGSGVGHEALGRMEGLRWLKQKAGHKVRFFAGEADEPGRLRPVSAGQVANAWPCQGTRLLSALK